MNPKAVRFNQFLTLLMVVSFGVLVSAVIAIAAFSQAATSYETAQMQCTVAGGAVRYITPFLGVFLGAIILGLPLLFFSHHRRMGMAVAVLAVVGMAQFGTGVVAPGGDVAQAAPLSAPSGECIRVNGSNAASSNISWGGFSITGLGGLAWNADGVGDIGTSSVRVGTVYSDALVSASATLDGGTISNLGGITWNADGVGDLGTETVRVAKGYFDAVVLRDASVSNDVRFSNLDPIIGLTTADAADNGQLTLLGAGGTGQASRGGVIQIAGNEHANVGNVAITAGLSGTGVVTLGTGGAVQWTVATDGDLNATGSQNIGGSNNLTLNPGIGLTLAPVNGVTLVTGDLGSTGTRVTKGWFTDIDSTNAVNVSSSGKYKRNIVPLTPETLSAVDIINLLTVATYEHDLDLDPSGRNKLGLIAESVEAAYPLAAPSKLYPINFENTLVIDRDSQGNPTGTHIERQPQAWESGPGIDTGALNALMVAGIQTLSQQLAGVGPALPVCDASTRGKQFVVLSDVRGDAAYICLRKVSGSYGWKGL